MLFVAIFLLLGAALQLWAGIATARRVGELRSLQARQLEKALGRRGTIAFFFIASALLGVAGMYLAVLAARGG